MLDPLEFPILESLVQLLHNTRAELELSSSIKSFRDVQFTPDAL